MSDIKTTLSPTELGQLPAMDWALDGFQLAEDEGLETAITISLFTDRLADIEDELPDHSGNRRGWWADSYATDRIGSRLWLLSRAKQTPAVLALAEFYATEALQWLVDDGVAEAVDVAASKPRPGLLALNITVTRAKQPTRQYAFELFWKGNP